MAQKRRFKNLQEAKNTFKILFKKELQNRYNISINCIKFKFYIFDRSITYMYYNERYESYSLKVLYSNRIAYRKYNMTVYIDYIYNNINNEIIINPVYMTSKMEI